MESAKPIHAEAFCLITYCSADGKFEEQIWNSREGPTPCVVYARDAQTPLQHVHSQGGTSSASQPLRIGDRIFVDMTLVNAIAHKQRMVENEWENPEFQRIVVKSLVCKLGNNPSPLSIAQHLAQCEFEHYGPPGPELIVVDESVLERLRPIG